MKRQLAFALEARSQLSGSLGEPERRTFRIVHETDETSSQIVKNARTTTPPIAILTRKPVDMVDELEEGDGGVYDDGGGCEDRVVPGEGGEL
ncbi:hypothetical protein F0562_015088 [Nyssa sinensis]|uniref:Uncharacterized protein n=1 Tax=Nyssa sinensis TaxID=561372 RepID=A0A5J4ZIG8_9ASTE|nr:hypothetical protein F0562_015088 [Nyssa sinensis]